MPIRASIGATQGGRAANEPALPHPFRDLLPPFAGIAAARTKNSVFVVRGPARLRQADGLSVLPRLARPVARRASRLLLTGCRRMAASSSLEGALPGQRRAAGNLPGKHSLRPARACGRKTPIARETGFAQPAAEDARARVLVGLFDLVSDGIRMREGISDAKMTIATRPNRL